MAFEIISADINALVDRRLVRDVSIERRLYHHSEARVVIDWDETDLEGNKRKKGLHPTANLGAAMLNAEIALTWRGKNLRSNIECFQGYVTGVSARRGTTRSHITLDCVSWSKRADLVPRYRVFQSCTLLDICQHISGAESIFQIQSDAEAVLGGISIELSVQYDETDFAYLGRMLHAWGIPMYTDDRTNKIGIGGPKANRKGAFPTLNWHCDAITLEGSLIASDDKARNVGSGATGTAKQYVNKFNASLNRSATHYFPRLDDDHEEEKEWIADRVYDSSFQANAAVYRIEWSGTVFDAPPGAGLTFADQSFLVRSSQIKNQYGEVLTQEVVLQDYMAPLQLHQRRVPWPSRMFWARVTKNTDEDPTRQGRMQVEFDWEKLDPTIKGDQRCWLPTMTPYGGLKGKNGTSGLLSLPEVGERVLVQFLGEWDSDAVIMGSVREYTRDGFIYDPHLTKRWQTPSGNQITMTTKKDGSDIVRIKCQDQLVFEGKIANGKKSLIFDLFDSDTERIHFEKGGGPPRLDIFCSGEIYMHAEQKLLLEGGMVQIKSTSGAINIDGAPMVMLNCGPWSLQPLKRDPDKGQESPDATAKKRAKPPTWSSLVTAVASPAAAASVAQEAQQHFIEFILRVKETGESIPDERYRVKLPDGSIREGRTDGNGRVRVDGIPAGQCQISYPDMDADSWESL